MVRDRRSLGADGSKKIPFFGRRIFVFSSIVSGWCQMRASKPTLRRGESQPAPKLTHDWNQPPTVEPGEGLHSGYGRGLHEFALWCSWEGTCTMRRIQP